MRFRAAVLHCFSRMSTDYPMGRQSQPCWTSRIVITNVGAMVHQVPRNCPTPSPQGPRTNISFSVLASNTQTQSALNLLMCTSTPLICHIVSLSSGLWFVTSLAFLDRVSHRLYITYSVLLFCTSTLPYMSLQLYTSMYMWCSVAHSVTLFTSLCLIK